MDAIKKIDYRKFSEQQTVQPQDTNEQFYASRSMTGLFGWLKGLDKKTKIEVFVFLIVCVCAVAIFVFYFTQSKVENKHLYSPVQPVNFLPTGEKVK